MTIALHFVMLYTQRMKIFLSCPRPIEYSSEIQPIVLTPAYATYPMGHAAEAFMFSRVFAALTGQTAASPLVAQLDRLAARISENRVVAGIHFPVDTPAGFVLAESMAEYFVSRCDGMSKIRPRTFDGADFGDASDFLQTDMYQAGLGTVEAVPANYLTATQSTLMNWLWLRARDEMKAQGYQ
jgi:hypothetical protein